MTTIKVKSRVIRCEGHSSSEQSVAKDQCNNQRSDSASMRGSRRRSPTCHSPSNERRDHHESRKRHSGSRHDQISRENHHHSSSEHHSHKEPHAIESVYYYSSTNDLPFTFEIVPAVFGSFVQISFVSLMYCI
jgi:hypothetical protein